MISPCPLPAEALLNRYRTGGGFADCYVTEIPRAVSHAEFVEAFYTTRLFKLERLLLRLFLSRSSTDLQAARLARGELDAFAAWSVEEPRPRPAAPGRRRRPHPVLADGGAVGGPASVGTRLYFGSAVVPRRSARSGRVRPGSGLQRPAGLSQAVFAPPAAGGAVAAVPRPGRRDPRAQPRELKATPWIRRNSIRRFRPSTCTCRRRSRTSTPRR